MADFFDFKSVGGVLAVKASPDGVGVTAWDFGWVDDPAAVAVVAATQEFPDASATPAGMADDAALPSSAYLWKAFFTLFGKNPTTRNQRQVGSCVGFGTTKAVETTMAVEIAINGEAEEWKDIAQEVTYGGSRVEVGNGRIRGDGSVGAWAAEFVRRWGVVARGVYGGLDLSTYSEQTCREYGDRGVPADLEALAKSHPVKDTTLVKSWADAKKMLAAGYGLAVCSTQGFSMTRDANGVCRPSGNWGHCMAIDGYHTDEAGNEYGHIDNSWGPNAHTGPVGWGDPSTSGFWASAEVIDPMIRAGDTWAFAAVQGFPARVIDWSTVL